MKRKYLLLLLASFALSANAQAQDWCLQEPYCSNDNECVPEKKFYAKTWVGANFLQNTTIDGNKSTYQTGCLISGSLGCYYSDLRLEGEYVFRRNDIRKIHFLGEGASNHGHFKTYSWMANLIWDLPLSLVGNALCNIRPYIGVGIGYDFQKMHSSNSRIVFHQTWNHFSWQVMTGLVYPILCNTEMALEYKFHQGGCHFNNHSLGIGVTYKFAFLR